MTSPGFGITAIGSYVPRARLPGKLVAEAHGWFEPSLEAVARGSRSFCGWDEDAISMAVEAARGVITRPDSITSIELASTTLPFADRSNAGILREALGLPEQAMLADSGGSMRAASSALLRAIDSDADRLVVASDCVESKPASANEATVGHAAAAVRVGHDAPIAILRGTASLNQDFVDHYRAAGEDFSYQLETRWVRDAGYREQTAATFATALDQAGLADGNADHLVVAAPPVLARAIAKSLGRIDTGAELSAKIGYCGAAHPLLLLNHAFETAGAGDTVALVTVGQGVDVAIFEQTRELPSRNLAGQIASGIEEENYTRYLALRRLLDLEEGIRAERDNRTAQAAFWRKHEAITGFVGGKCGECGTLQFPPSKVCVACKAEDSQEPVRMADMQGTVRSFTEDWLAFTPNPPLVFGNVGFEDGANVMMEFTDVVPGQLKVGMPVDLRFRIKDFDHRRQYRRYFWKPTPALEA
ncbi:MAG: OB-fold domain-containing protein [Woeseiaceae bacterium]|nr:OB-fold domain-containing protein [Woeseiaceae bacterium]